MPWRWWTARSSGARSDRWGPASRGLLQSGTEGASRCPNRPPHAEHVHAFDRTEVAAVEAAGRRRQDENLARREGEAAGPPRQRASEPVGTVRPGDCVTVDGHHRGMPAHDIARPGCNRLYDERPAGQVAALDRKRTDLTRQADDRQLASGGRAR